MLRRDYIDFGDGWRSITEMIIYRIISAPWASAEVPAQGRESIIPMLSISRSAVFDIFALSATPTCPRLRDEPPA